MSKGCRDPSDIILKRRIFSSVCECDCESQEIVSSALGPECVKCSHIQTKLPVNSTKKPLNHNDRLTLDTFVKLIDALKEIKYDFKLQVGVVSGGLIKILDTESNAKQTIENIKNKLDDEKGKKS